MGSLKTLIKNIRYLSRYNLKIIDKDIKYLKGGLNFLKYELLEDLPELSIPKIMTCEQTIDNIINYRRSLARFGDGEFLLVNNTGIAFQKADKNLSKRLKEVLTNKVDNLDIGLPYGMCHSTRNQNEYLTNFSRTFWGNNTDWILDILDKNRIYANTGCTILPDSADKYNHIRQIWENRDITVICGDRVIKNIKHNVFDNAKSIEYIFAPTVNAFSEYDRILEKAKQIPPTRLVCIILGPTATVLAHDLAKLGYQGLDLGHIVKSYNTFMENHDLTPEYLAKFFYKD